jgi:hypothetical protein
MIEQDQKSPETLKLRHTSLVMRLKRMGSFHQSRLSFMRVLLRRIKKEGWRFESPLFDIDDQGVGVATYSVTGPKRTYTLVAFAHDLPAELRSDRVIAEAWDSTFTLFDGVPTQGDIERLSKNVPLQEAGRISEKEISLSRANRSVRLFEYVTECLSKGEQPDVGEIEKVGYLMRTTAVYGSSKFGACDREKWADREEFSGSFQPELLAVWLIRTFAIDMVEHMASVRGGDKAVKLEPNVRRCFGVGNSTGLGMAPFLINHPALIHAWINGRETAIATVRSLKNADEAKVSHFKNIIERARLNADQWHTDHEHQHNKIQCLRKDLTKISEILKSDILDQAYPWDALHNWAEENLGFEGQEQLVSVMLEPYGELIDNLSTTMRADESAAFRINGSLSIETFEQSFKEIYQWANDIDFEDKDANARVWYVSEEKLEPRLGERHEEEVEPYEQPLAPGRDAKRLIEDLADWDKQETVAAFLMKHPEHRHIVRRAQLVASKQYSEIYDNTISSKMLPIDLLRCKLSFFGATKFDPRSDRWVRITMYQGAPYPDEIATLDPDDLAYPPLQRQ